MFTSEDGKYVQSANDDFMKRLDENESRLRQRMDENESRLLQHMDEQESQLAQSMVALNKSSVVHKPASKSEKEKGAGKEQISPHESLIMHASRQKDAEEALAFNGQTLEDYRTYSATLPIEKIASMYESQKQGSNNCYCCAASALYNQHLLNKARSGEADEPAKEDFLTQYDVRAFTPEFKNFAQMVSKPEDMTRQQFNVYLREKGTVMSYASPTSHDIGNVFAISDMFIKLDPSICTNFQTFLLHGLDATKQRIMENYFLDSVKKVLDTGEAVALYKDGHYTTIIGIEGSMVTYLDSKGSTDAERIQICSVNELLTAATGVIDITWISKRPDDPVASFTNLSKSEGGELFSKTEIKENDISHTLGVDVEIPKEEMNDVPQAIKESVNHFVYVPKEAGGETVKVSQLRADKKYEIAEDAASKTNEVFKFMPYVKAFKDAYLKLVALGETDGFQLSIESSREFEEIFRERYIKANPMEAANVNSTPPEFPFELIEPEKFEQMYREAIKGTAAAELEENKGEMKINTVALKDILNRVDEAIEYSIDKQEEEKAALIAKEKAAKEKSEKERAEKEKKEKEKKEKEGTEKEKPKGKEEANEQQDSVDEEELKTEEEEGYFLETEAEKRATAEAAGTKTYDLAELVEKKNYVDEISDYESNDAFKDLVAEFTKLKGKSKEYIALQKVLGNAGNTALQDVLAKKFTLNGESYTDFLKIYNTVSAYVLTHAGSYSKDSKKRYEIACRMLTHLDQVAKALLIENGKELPESYEEVNYSKGEINYVKENVKRMMAGYKTYCSRVDADPIATEEEKLRRKWDALKTSERDIRVYLKYADVVKRDKSDKYPEYADELRLIYTSIKMQISFRSHVRESGHVSAFDNQTDDELKAISFSEYGTTVTESKRNESLNQEDGLTNAQIAALSRIDTWVMRNIRNGGYLSLFGVVSDRTDLASRLFSMSRRKRMYIYYLVETRERVSPNLEGFLRSQTTYKPDIDKFKGAMIANKLKFYKRFSGGYIFWHKLNEAIGIAEGHQHMIETMENAFDPELAQKEKAAIENPDDEKKQLSPADRRYLKLREILPYLMRGIELARRNEEKGVSDVEKERNQQTITYLGLKVETLKNEILALDAEMETGKKGSETKHKPQVRQYISTLPGDVSKIGKTAGGFAKFADLSKDAAKQLGEYNATMTGIGTFGSLAGAVFTLITLHDNWRSMTTIDFAGSVADLTMTGIKASTGITGIIAAAGATSAGIDLLTCTPVGLVVSAVDTGVTIAKAASWVRDGCYRDEALNAARKKNNPDKYLKGMMKLSEKLETKQSISTAGKILTSSVTLTSSVLIGLSVATGGVGAVVGAGVFVAGLVLKSVDKRLSREMKMEIFDNFYNMDEKCEHAEAEWQKRNPGEKLTDKVKEDIRVHLRYRLSSHMGFASPAHAARPLAEIYADEILKRARSDDQEEKTMYINFIKGLGLSYEYDKDDEENSVPKVSDIVKKMMS